MHVEFRSGNTGVCRQFGSLICFAEMNLFAKEWIDNGSSNWRMDCGGSYRGARYVDDGVDYEQSLFPQMGRPWYGQRGEREKAAILTRNQKVSYTKKRNQKGSLFLIMRPSYSVALIRRCFKYDNAKYASSYSAVASFQGSNSEGLERYCNCRGLGLLVYAERFSADRWPRIHNRCRPIWHAALHCDRHRSAYAYRISLGQGIDHYDFARGQG